MSFNYNKVLRELQDTIYVEDPLAYTIGKQIRDSILKREPFLISFWKTTYDRGDILLDQYWKKVDYQYLPKIYYGDEIVWFEFIGKHIQIVN